MKIKLIIICLLCGVSNAFSQFDVNKMFPNAIMTRVHYDKLMADIKNGSTAIPVNWYNNQVLKPAQKILTDNKPIIVAVSRKDNPDNVNIEDEMNNIRKLCIAYTLSKNSAYLNKAVDYLKAWAAVNVAISRENIHENVYNAAIEGYSMIRNILSDEDRTLIDGWIRKRAQVFVMDNDLRENNWGTCLMYQFYLLGMVLNDADIVNMYLDQYDEWVKRNLYPNGITVDLLARDAFAYHAYDLLFYAKIYHLKAMYEGYKSADSFYARNVYWGASIKKSVSFWKPFLLNPEKCPHLEFVRTEYAPDKNRSDYNKPYKPANTLYAVHELYEADQSLDEVLNHYNQSPDGFLPLGLSYLRWHYNVD